MNTEPQPSRPSRAPRQAAGQRQNKTPQGSGASVVAALLIALLVFTACGQYDNTGETTAAATEHQWLDAGRYANTPINKPGWEHTISSRSGSTYVVEVNREIGRANVERLEHIAETLDRIAALLENHTGNDGHQHPTIPAPNDRTGQQDNDNS